MMPGTVDLDIYHGDTHSWTIRLWEDEQGTDPFDIDGATAKAEIRKEPGSPVLAALGCTITAPNTIKVSLDADTSETLPITDAAWDLQLTMSNGDINTVVAGAVVITGDITDSGGVTVQEMQQQEQPPTLQLRQSRVG